MKLLTLFKHTLTTVITRQVREMTSPYYAMPATETLLPTTITKANFVTVLLNLHYTKSFQMQVNNHNYQFI